ncbi:hypothetical protein CANMA_004605 [Candida margitis]|uniref:uncharacterized protein n=1 Tax=Candida margitis TaxID=1775924 RepID=UPI002226872E|nr:uncharacterized protein CANMA_004605 [Candida margitis]KAI5955425.1 hypothetical protein CANMA_004605 [Candida margitis]
MFKEPHTTIDTSVNEIPQSPSQQHSLSDSDSELSLTEYKDHLIEQHQSQMPQFHQNSMSISTFSSPLSDGIEDNKHRSNGLSLNGEETEVKHPSNSPGNSGSGSTSADNLSSVKGSVRRKPPPDILVSPQSENEMTQDESNTSPINEAEVDSHLSQSGHKRKTNTFKRFSAANFNNFGKVMDSLKRSASMRTFKTPEKESHIYKTTPDTDPVSQTPIFESPQSNTSTASTIEPIASEMPFWKYHILRFGKDLYLTTNPGTKYIHCRNGPSFYVEVVIESGHSQGSKPDEDYSLIFKDPNNLSQDPRQCMVISKKHDQQKGYFNIRTPKNTYLAADGTVEKYEDLTMFKTMSFPSSIGGRYFPFDGLREGTAKYFTNYEIKDLLNVSWNVGSIPRVRVSRMNQMREKIKGANKDASGRNEEEELKLVGKRNIYFHQNYTNSKCEGQYSPSEKIYDSSTDFPSVLSMFRPNEHKITKRLVQSMKQQQQQKNRHIPSVHSASDDFESNQNNTKTFYNGSDGLYYSRDTRDDNPDENKSGWLTIYENAEVFGGTDNRGMFDVVLGMTLAVGFDTYLKDNMAAKR